MGPERHWRRLRISRRTSDVCDLTVCVAAPAQSLCLLASSHRFEAARRGTREAVEGGACRVGAPDA